MPLLVGSLVEGEGFLAAGLVRNDGLGAAIIEPLAQRPAIVGSITKQLFRRLGAADQSLCRRAVVCLAAGQQEGKKTAFSICDCMDFRVAPAARASNRLRLFPLFAPDAER